MKKTMLIISALLLTSICWAQETVGNHAKPNKQIQESAVKPGEGYTFAKGDTIVISKSCTKYLTGETPSTWVYYVKHIVEQQGGKRFPNGILIHGIYSWVGPEDLLLTGPTAQTEAAAAKKAADKKSVVERQEEVKQMPVEEQQSIAQAVKEHEAVAIEEPAQVVEEASAQVVEEVPVVVAPVVVEQPVEQPVEEPAKETPKEEPAQVVEEAPAQVAEEAPAQVAEEAPVVVAPVVVEQPVEQPIEQPVEEPAEEVKVKEEAGKVSKVEKMPAVQFDRFNIGLRGGVASVMQKADKGDWKVGGDILLDLQYAHYWKRDYKPALGLIIGASVGYSLSPIKCGVNDNFTVNEGAEDQIDYAINVDQVKEKDGQIQVEVPVMFSLITDKGFFFNVGPRFMLPVWKRSHTDIENAHIQATLPNEGVTVTDNVVTGILNNGDVKNSWKSADINIMLTCELGYEWKLANGHALELGVYADYSVYSKYSNTPTTESFINVTAPSAAGIANASARALTDSYANKLGYFDAGIKLTYCFNFWKTGAQLR